jgi:hypothetical protein
MSHKFSRGNHFNDFLRELQGNSSSEISSGVIDIIKNELVEKQIEPSISSIKYIIREKSMTQYLRFIPKIYSIITKQQLPQFTKEPNIETTKMEIDPISDIHDSTGDVLLCSICLDEITNKDTIELKCGHMFHSQCIEIWCKTPTNTCPNCRSEIVFENVIYLTTKTTKLIDIEKQLMSEFDILSRIFESKQSESGQRRMNWFPHYYIVDKLLNISEYKVFGYIRQYLMTISEYRKFECDIQWRIVYAGTKYADL